MSVSLVPSPPAGLLLLGSFVIESEGLVSLRDLHFREHDAMGVEPGYVTVSVFGDSSEPSSVALVVSAA